jgi:RES domain-containing protein
MPLPPLVELALRDTVRLISTGRLKPAALLPLAADLAAFEDLAELESLTNGRLQAQAGGLPDLDPRELVFGQPQHSFVNAAFTHTRPGGNRFNDESRGAWYCGLEVRTSLGEVAYHLTRELAAIDRFENRTDYAELLADIAGAFHDLCSADRAGEPALHENPRVAYPAGQALARRLRHEHHSEGIVYPSIRHAGGTCLVVFVPNLIQRVRQGAIWRLEWQGSPVPMMTCLDGRTA